VTIGISATHANELLGVFRGTTYTGITVYAKLHLGDPGAAGAANASTMVTRNGVTWAAPSAGSMAMSALASWTMTATETVTHLSLWDASTAGNMEWSLALSAAVPVISGSTLTVSALTLSFTPIAA
jgi:hypothetical protein